MYIDLYHDGYLKYIGEDHAAIPFIHFVCSLASKSTACCRAVLEAGLLDQLLPLCSLELFFDLSDGKTSVVHACNSIMYVFSSDPVGFQIFSGHALYIIWPNVHDAAQHLKVRQQVWKTLGPKTDAVYLRLQAVDKVALFSDAA